MLFVESKCDRDRTGDSQNAWARSRNRFRSGLYAAARADKVSVRGQPDGSVRITKVGEWSSVRG